MKTNEKKLILDEINEAVEAGNLNEWIISLVDWFSLEANLSIREILNDKELRNFTNK